MGKADELIKTADKLDATAKTLIETGTVSDEATKAAAGKVADSKKPAGSGKD